MKNEEKYKTAEERKKKFREYCRSQPLCGSCPLFDEHNTIWTAGCAMAWLEFEAKEEKPLPCPFCGGEIEEVASYSMIFGDKYHLACSSCAYRTKAYPKTDEAITAHNRVAQAVARAKEREEAK